MVSFLSRFRRAVLKESKKERPAEKPTNPVRAEKPRRKPKVKFELQAQEIINQAQKDAAQVRQEAEAEARKIRQEAEELRSKAISQEAEISRKLGAIEEREKIIGNEKQEVERRLAEVENTKKEELAKLEKIAALTCDEAKNLILKGTEKKLAEDISRRIKEAEDEVKSRSEDAAKEILIESMQRGATDYVVEYTVSTIRLDDEEMKGRIIGREGRNIRAFERATGVEIELDETSDISISSFDPIRREIARRSLEKLIKDRRIRPGQIEEVVQRTKEEMDKILFEEGENFCHRVKVYRLHPDLVRLLGRYKFRFSYGQNLGVHTLEVVKIGVAIAYETKADVNLVRLGCLLHDIGKVATEEEGTHVNLGVDLAKKYRLPQEVVSCIAEHHEDLPFSSVESRIVWVADAISGARPGARYEPHEEYLKRMTDIEKAASSFDGVEAAFAYQAGRDVRVLVRPDEVNDKELAVLAHKIRQELEEKVNYVGQIKVTCIRELRTAETTKSK